MTCVEADGCKSLGRVFPKYGPEFGLDVVYQAGVSLAQPDYTAECLNARNAACRTSECLERSRAFIRPISSFERPIA